MAVVTRDGILYRMRDDGGISWRRKLPGEGSYAAPLVVRGYYDQIIVGDSAGHVSSFNGSGALMWSVKAGSAVHGMSGPVSGLILAGTQGDGVLVLTPAGQLLGALPARDAVHGVAVFARKADVLAVYGARDGFVRAYSLAVSKRPWELPVP